MSRKDIPSSAKPRKLSVKKQTVRDLPATASAAQKVRGGGSRTGAVAEGDSRYCVAVC